MLRKFNPIPTDVKLGEGPRLEFKPDFRDARELAKHVCAFANTDGGTILVGVRTPDVIVGCDSARVKRMFEQATGMIDHGPPSSIQSYMQAGKDVCKIVIEKTNHLVSTPDGAFVRDGLSILAMSAEQIQLKILRVMDATSIRDLATLISRQAETIDRLRGSIDRSDSFGAKFREWVISGIVGAILGVIVSKLSGL